MNEQRQDDQLETYIQQLCGIQNIALKTPLEQWTIRTGGKRGSGRSVLAARHDEDHDIRGAFNKFSDFFLYWHLKLS